MKKEELTSPFKPAPAPNHALKFNLVCAQANVQGMARRLSIPPTQLHIYSKKVFKESVYSVQTNFLPLGFLFAGRLPIFRILSSNSGVACLKYGTKSGSSLTS